MWIPLRRSSCFGFVESLCKGFGLPVRRKPSMEDENEYNRACFEAISGNADEAIKLLAIAIENEQTTQDWITVDPDLDFIREDERFQALLIQPEESSLP